MEVATSISLIFNFLLTVLLLYFDLSRKSDGKNKDEVIKDLSLKLLSRSSVEYMQAKGEKVENTPEVESPYVDVEEIPDDKIAELKI